mmetsp:Transcript_125842/g.298722  ORF Transcript_125842/g.298722 Transcript_125842/m.298722 type:complete len:206 (+) Transcript_125842:801-1418(+)
MQRTFKTPVCAGRQKRVLRSQAQALQILLRRRLQHLRRQILILAEGPLLRDGRHARRTLGVGCAQRARQAPVVGRLLEGEPRQLPHVMEGALLLGRGHLTLLRLLRKRLLQSPILGRTQKRTRRFLAEGLEVSLAQGLRQSAVLRCTQQCLGGLHAQRIQARAILLGLKQGLLQGPVLGRCQQRLRCDSPEAIHALRANALQGHF